MPRPWSTPLRSAKSLISVIFLLRNNNGLSHVDDQKIK